MPCARRLLSRSLAETQMDFEIQAYRKMKTMSPLNTELQQEERRETRKITARASVPSAGSTSARLLLREDAFASMLYLERRRAERARKHFVLMLVDVKRAIADGQGKRTLGKISGALTDSIRETDIVGWYLENNLLGVIGTELGKTAAKTVRMRMLEKVRREFHKSLGAEKTALISFSFHFFPEETEDGNTDHSANITLYPDLSRQDGSKKFALGIKRAMDIAGSAAALALLSPVYAAIAVAIKMNSKGPVLFRQERLGQYGKPFTVLKFRSMRTDCDARIHQEYVNQFIAGQVEGKASDGSAPVFKIQKDPRVTSIGRFLRKTSLDELPQFWNVLRGDMSLVGPRPPIAYEFKAYDLWHRRRVLEIKPGVTGLWQVEGRSRTRFDDMVRLDLKYARGWSIWLDLKILVQTPAAVFTGEGAH
jgi:lipopolysaccharide/colanic/teichoic acid biosynthesis glycosyltransferase